MVLTLLPRGVSAYSLGTHEGLTVNMVKAYEQWKGNALSESEADAIIKGSVAEDDGTRPLNHFFDPVHDRGLTMGTELGEASKRWAQDTLAQANYCDATSFLCKFSGGRLGKDDKLFSSPTDYTWDRAVYEYAWGDKDRALQSLGHVLHLLEDKTVPAHVRNDQHLSYGGYSDSDPYETYTSQFTKNTVPLPSKVNVQRHANLNAYLDQVSEYTNSRFVSKDTLFKNFVSPNINELKVIGDFVYFNSTEHKVAHVKKKLNKERQVYETTLVQDDEKNSVASSNFQALSKVAIENGVGVIDLFFRSVEVEKKTLALKQKNMSQNERDAKALAASGFKYVKSLYGSSLAQGDVEELLGQTASAGAIPLTEQSPVTVVLTEEAPVAIVLSEPAPSPVPLSENAPPEIPNENNVFLPTTENVVTPTVVVEQPLPPTPQPELPFWQRFLTPVIAGFGGGGSGGVSESSQSSAIVDASTSTTNTPTTPQDTAAPDAPVITSSLIFATSSVELTGTAELDSLVTLSTGATTTAVGGVFNFSLILLDGDNPFTLTATDATGNMSSTTSVTISVFISQPSPPTLSVVDCAASVVTSFCLLPSDTITINWTAPLRTVSYALVKNGVQQATTTATSTSFVLSYGATTTFSVIAYDTVGNASPLATAVPVRATRLPVVINEVAWAGTTASTTDQWIELFNNTNSAVDLSTLSIASSDGAPFIPLSGTIAPKGYFVVERSALATSYPQEKVFDFEPLSQTGEQLLLLWSHAGSTSTVDKTPSPEVCGGWCAGGRLQTGYSYQYGTTTSAVSMERAFTDAEGGLAFNWHVHDRYFISRTDRANNVVYGSPGRENTLNYADFGWSTTDANGNYRTPLTGTTTGYRATSFSMYRTAWLGPSTVPRMGGIFKGSVGSSTAMRVHGLGGEHEKTWNEDWQLTPLIDGAQYFTALWEMPVSGPDHFSQWLRTGVQPSGSTNPPHTNYRIIPWTFRQ